MSLTVADALPPNSPIVSDQLSLREFANEFIIGKIEWRKFLVTGSEGQLVGMILVDDLKTIPSSYWSETQVKELTKPVELATTVQSDQSLLEVVTLLEERQLSQLPVVRDNGVLVGLLEKAAIARLLQKQVQANPA